MTTILLHVEGRLDATVQVEPDTLRTRTDQPDFPVATAFRAHEQKLPDIVFDEGVFAGSLLSEAALLPDVGQSVEMAISCGTTEVFTVTREDNKPRGKRIARNAQGSFDIDATPLLEMMTDTQRHFITRAPRR